MFLVTASPAGLFDTLVSSYRVSRVATYFVALGINQFRLHAGKALKLLRSADTQAGTGFLRGEVLGPDAGGSQQESGE